MHSCACRRMAQLRVSERMAKVEDLMYACILEKFMRLGVAMLPRLDVSISEQQADLTALTDGVHSKEVPSNPRS